MKKFKIVIITLMVFLVVCLGIYFAWNKQSNKEVLANPCPKELETLQTDALDQLEFIKVKKYQDFVFQKCLPGDAILINEALNEIMQNKVNKDTERKIRSVRTNLCCKQ